MKLHIKIWCGKIDKHKFHLRIIRDESMNFIKAIVKPVSLPFPADEITEDKAIQMENELQGKELIDVFSFEI